MSASKVFVKLLGDGKEVWRSTTARPLSDDVFQILGIPRPGEKWEFAPGSRVQCELRKFDDGSIGLVAARLVS